ncbi:MAG TPA: hypothetical protein QF571_06255, partial [Desulfobacterales bacterium]|nr:hypothetical protein [Desulfobacterales bacterium]
LKISDVEYGGNDQWEENSENEKSTDCKKKPRKRSRVNVKLLRWKFQISNNREACQNNSKQGQSQKATDQDRKFNGKFFHRTF